ncbi:MAG: rod shape-determining protein, partial [Patescibacteria group bacterium]
VIDAAESAGAREAYVIEEPMAAAIGVGIPVNEPIGNLVVDIGGGTTDIAIISLGGIVVDKTIPIAGDEMDEQIVDYLKDRYGILIGRRSAEKIKMTVGSAIPLKKEKFVAVQGRDIVKGLPRSIEIGSNDVAEAVAPSLVAMTDAIKQAIEDAPPELVSDVYSQGILLTGGGGKLEGLDKYWEEALHIKVKRPSDPSYSVVLGTLEALKHIDVLRKLKEAEKSLL